VQKIYLTGFVQSVKVEKDKRLTTLVIKQNDSDLEIILSNDLAEFVLDELTEAMEVDCNYIQKEAV
jgi:hypothetical protein